MPCEPATGELVQRRHRAADGLLNMNNRQTWRYTHCTPKTEQVRTTKASLCDRFCHLSLLRIPSLRNKVLQAGITVQRIAWLTCYANGDSRIGRFIDTLPMPLFDLTNIVSAKINAKINSPCVRNIRNLSLFAPSFSLSLSIAAIFLFENQNC